MDYSIIKSLIPLVEEFEKESNSNDLTDFVIWLNNKLFGNTSHNEISEHDNLLIAFRVMFLNKELKRQTKEILTESKVSSIDEYSFLLHLKFQNSFRKMEIIELHNLEAPTGIEIIKRLLKNKLIEEFPDENDKRAKRIKATKAGEKEIAFLEPKINKIFLSFTEKLSLNEKVQLAGTLNKLTPKK